jgi:hypothetical protein
MSDPISELISSILSVFVDHPKSVCMTYLQHFRFSFKMAFVFLGTFVSCLIHAFFPCYCVTCVTDTQEYVERELTKVGCRKTPQDNTDEYIRKIHQINTSEHYR